MSRRIVRSFAFLDLCGFTAFMDEHGDQDALTVLAQLRIAVRTAGERLGVRVDKWLGDGLMLVGMESEPLLACAIEIGERMQTNDSLALRGGISSGAVLLFEGNEYIGPAVNIAARLCATAKPGELLIAEAPQDRATDDVPAQVTIRGLSRPVHVRSIYPSSKTLAVGRSSGRAPRAPRTSLDRADAPDSHQRRGRALDA